MRIITEIIIHCSATREGLDYSVADLRTWHRNRGFSDVGYHYIVYRDGSVHAGRPLNRQGAHCRGHNAHSIGICYIGGLTADGSAPKDTRTPMQRESLRALVQLLHRNYPNATLHGHNEFAAKACPSFNVATEF